MSSTENTQTVAVPAKSYPFRVPSFFLGFSLGGLATWTAISAVPEISKLVKGKHHLIMWPAMFACGFGLMAANFNRQPYIQEEEKK